MPYSGMAGNPAPPLAETSGASLRESMRERLRQTDWSQTSLGPIEGWDPALANAVSLCLESKFSLLVLAGQEMVCIYNDALVPGLESKHPDSFGKPAQQVWPETWDTIGPMLRSVQRTGKAVRHNDRALLVRRGGRARRRYFTFSFSPVINAEGRMVAVFVVTLETTARVVQERRLEMLNRLASAIASAFSPDQIFACAAQALLSNPEDIPLSGLYLCEHNGDLRLAFLADHAAGSSQALPTGLPATNAADASDAGGSAAAENGLSAAVRRALRHGQMGLFQLPQPVAGPDSILLTQAVALPINLPGALTTQGVFVVALNPLLPWDDDYRSFLTVVLGHLGTGLAANEAAQETSSFLSIVFEHAPSGMAIADANGMLMRANDAYASLRALPKDMLTGTPMQSAYPSQDRHGNAPLQQLLQQAAAASSRETRYVRPGGDTVWVAEQMSLVRDPRGQPRFVVITTRDISETVTAKQEAQAARDELGKLYERLQTIREEERVAIAREVHDQLGQVLSAAKIDIDLLAQRLAHQADPLSRDEARAELQSAQSALDSALDLVRVIASELRAARLQEQGLYAAVHWHARDFQQRTRIRCRVLIAPALYEPDGECAVTLFRIMQEALTNVLRHAMATDVAVSFHLRGTAIKLRVRDNGVGVSRGAVRNTSSLGLRGMRERAALHGGRLLLGACSHHGTLVSALIPLPAAERPNTA